MGLVLVGGFSYVSVDGTVKRVRSKNVEISKDNAATFQPLSQLPAPFSKSGVERSCVVILDENTFIVIGGRGKLEFFFHTYHVLPPCVLQVLRAVGKQLFPMTWGQTTTPLNQACHTIITITPVHLLGRISGWLADTETEAKSRSSTWTLSNGVKVGMMSLRVEITLVLQFSIFRFRTNVPSNYQAHGHSSLWRFISSCGRRWRLWRVVQWEAENVEVSIYCAKKNCHYYRESTAFCTLSDSILITNHGMSWRPVSLKRTLTTRQHSLPPLTTAERGDRRAAQT